MTELSFLIDLLMNHKLPRGTKELIAQRIKEVEGRYQPQQAQPRAVSHVAQPIPQPVETIAQTEAAQAALARREAAMRGEIDKSIYKAKPKPAAGT